MLLRCRVPKNAEQMTPMALLHMPPTSEAKVFWNAHLTVASRPVGMASHDVWAGVF